MVTDTIIAGVNGKRTESANPAAALENIAGKIIPPRHPKEKQKLVTKAFPIAIKIKNNADCDTASLEKPSNCTSPENIK